VPCSFSSRGPESALRIVIVDDHSVVVFAEATTGREAVDVVNILQA
jgi:hypothetical protein